MRRGFGCALMLLGAMIAFAMIGSLVVGAGYNGGGPVQQAFPGVGGAIGQGPGGGTSFPLALVAVVLIVSAVLYLLGLGLFSAIPSDGLRPDPWWRRLRYPRRGA